MNEDQIKKLHAVRLQVVLDKLGLNAYGLAKVLGYKQSSSVYHILKERNKMSLKFIEKLVKHYPNVSYLYLKNGTGEPLLDTKGMIIQQNLLGYDEVPLNNEELIMKSLEELHQKFDLILSKLK